MTRRTEEYHGVSHGPRRSGPAGSRRSTTAPIIPRGKPAKLTPSPFFVLSSESAHRHHISIGPESGRMGPPEGRRRRKKKSGCSRNDERHEGTDSRATSYRLSIDYRLSNDRLSEELQTNLADRTAHNPVLSITLGREQSLHGRSSPTEQRLRGPPLVQNKVLHSSRSMCLILRHQQPLLCEN